MLRCARGGKVALAAADRFHRVLPPRRWFVFVFPEEDSAIASQILMELQLYPYGAAAASSAQG
jgi:hypothetical protein